MAPEYNYSNSLPVDNKSLAMQIAEASRYEQSGASSKYQQEKRSADSASIASKSSFGSTVGLLKSKFNSKSISEADKKRVLDQEKIMRNQVNIVG